LASHQVKTYCRFCHAYCPMLATVEDDRLIAIAPDTDNEIYGGYTCVKGRQMLEQIYHPQRLEQSQKRQPDGSFSAIGSQQAMDEIAAQLQTILEKYGPRSIASYNGTYSFQNSAAHGVARAWHRAIGSPSYYTSVTIDQPAKVAIAPARMGWWNAGSHMWSDSDVALVIGNNTLISHFSVPGGVPSFSPANALREGRKRGLKLICVDPRKSEVASRSDLHLQVKPGQDAALLAGIIQIIIREDLYDQEFCSEHTKGLQQLDEATRPFTPEAVAAAADIPVEQIYEAARLFGAGPRGSAVTGTGPEMGPHPNLVQHLALALNAICGRHYRAGERVPNPGVLTPPAPRHAQATSPQPQWLEEGIASRIDEDIRETVVLSPYGPLKEMPTGIIADEMLTPGDGQIKALICVGGNPLLAWPDQQKTHRALAGLDLLVCIDVKMAATAQMADYVLAPKICLEREDVTLLTDIWYDKPYSQYTQAVVEARGDEIEEWQFFWEMGKRMGLQLSLNDAPLDMATLPTKLDLLKSITRGSRVPIEDIRARQGGHVQDIEDLIALPADPQTQGHLQLFPPGLDLELQGACADMTTNSDDAFPHLLVSRRMKYTHNSTGPEFSLLREKNSHNPAYIHSRDLAALDITDGDLIEVCSRHGRIPAVAASSDDVKPGVVSMAHSWGGTPDPAAQVDAKVRDMGSNTNRLIDNRESTERYSAMPRLSTVAVRVSKIS
jgi:anaerobic selenocysteine-containing dehydrogenase